MPKPLPCTDEGDAFRPCELASRRPTGESCAFVCNLRLQFFAVYTITGTGQQFAEVGSRAPKWTSGTIPQMESNPSDLSRPRSLDGFWRPKSSRRRCSLGVRGWQLAPEPQASPN